MFALIPLLFAAQQATEGLVWMSYPWDAPTLRAEMRSYLGSKGQYYRYKLGQLKLLPEQQKYIKQLFARYGYKDVEFEHFSEEIDFTNI